MAVADLDRLVDRRQGAGGGDRARDRDVGPVPLPEHDPLGGVEIGRGQIQLVLEEPEVVGPIGIGEHLGDVALDPAPGVDAGRQGAGEAGGEVDGRDLAEAAGQLAGEADRPQREGQRLAEEAAEVGLQEGREADVAERRG